MRLTRILFIILILINCNNLYSQQTLEKRVAKYFIEFFQSNETINFLQSNRDSIIIAYDVDSILTDCGIKTWGNKKLNVITVGENINKINKNGIFTSIKGTTSFIIVSKNTIDNITYFRIFRPKTGADGHFGVKKIKGRYIKQKTTYGWF